MVCCQGANESWILRSGKRSSPSSKTRSELHPCPTPTPTQSTGGEIRRGEEAYTIEGRNAKWVRTSFNYHPRLWLKFLLTGFCCSNMHLSPPLSYILACPWKNGLPASNNFCLFCLWQRWHKGYKTESHFDEQSSPSWDIHEVQEESREPVTVIADVYSFLVGCCKTSGLEREIWDPQAFQGGAGPTVQSQGWDPLALCLPHGPLSGNKNLPDLTEKPMTGNRLTQNALRKIKREGGRGRREGSTEDKPKKKENRPCENLGGRGNEDTDQKRLTKETKEKIPWHRIPGLDAKFIHCSPTKDSLRIWGGREASSEKENLRDPGRVWCDQWESGLASRLPPARDQQSALRALPLFIHSKELALIQCFSRDFGAGVLP